MVGNRRGTVIRPGQAAAQAFGLDLQVKDHRLTVGLVQTVDFHQGFKSFVRIGKHFGSGVAFEETGVDTGKGNPGCPLHLLMVQCADQQVFHIAVPP